MCCAPINLGAGPQLVPKGSHMPPGPPTVTDGYQGRSRSEGGVAPLPFGSASQVENEPTPTPGAVPVAVLVPSGLPVHEITQLLDRGIRVDRCTVRTLVVELPGEVVEPVGSTALGVGSNPCRAVPDCAAWY